MNPKLFGFAASVALMVAPVITARFARWRNKRLEDKKMWRNQFVGRKMLCTDSCVGGKFEIPVAVVVQPGENEWGIPIRVLDAHGKATGDEYIVSLSTLRHGETTWQAFVRREEGAVALEFVIVTMVGVFALVLMVNEIFVPFIDNIIDLHEHLHVAHHPYDMHVH